jgi:hypothetical protein
MLFNESEAMYDLNPPTLLPEPNVASSLVPTPESPSKIKTMLLGAETSL